MMQHTNFKPASFDWMINGDTQKKELDAKLREYFPGLPKDDAGKVMWGLVETMIPPIVASRFHAMDVDELAAQAQGNDHMAVAGWTCVWHESIGMPIISVVNNACSSQLRRKRIANWIRQLRKTTNWLHDSHTCSRYSQPNNEHNFCSKATFILEPAVLIQLPWHYSLFHQWLLASLHEVLLFERASLEFRHWPIRTKLYGSAKALLCMVRSLKERLYIGFALLVKNIVNCPTGPWPFAKEILDDVILHSVAPLRFLITGKAHKMLKIMKKWLWSSNQPYDPEDRKYLRYKDFFVEENLYMFFAEQCYSPDNWIMSETRFRPFKDPANVDKISSKLKYAKPLDGEPCEGKVQRIAEYQPLFHQHKTGKPFPLPFMLKNCKDLIQEHVIKAGRLKNELSPDILNTYDTDEFAKKAKETFNSGRLNKPQLSVLCSLLYWYTRSWQVDLQNKHSVLAKTLTMQLAILEREQIIRLTCICGDAVQELPRVTGITPTQASMAQEENEIKEYVQTINDMHCMTRQQFWQQLPVQWRRPRNDLEAMPPIKSEVIESMQIRVGKIIYTAARESFDREIPFPLWRRVQYILPSFLASYKLLPEENEVDQVKDNYLQLLHNTLLFHETKLEEWLQNPHLSKKKKQGKRKKPDMVAFALIKLMNIINNCLKDRLKAFMESVLQVPGFDELANSLLHWPQYMEATYPDIMVVDIASTGMTYDWQNKAYEFFRDMLTICQQTWPLSEIFYITKLVKISDLLCDLTTGCMLISVITVNSKPPVFNFEISKTLRRLAYGQNLLTDVDLMLILQKQRKMLQQLYSDIKKFYKENNMLTADVLFRLLEYIPDLEQQYVKRLLAANWHVLDNEVKELFITGRKCKRCSKSEKKDGSFIVCEACLEQKYPDVHYFCSVACKKARWQEEHMAEHLEFELGLGQYPDPNLLTA
ncbi:hypothetical protein B566_EDAN013922 [Ephemera danica]|nr:hypothetical protein B566_EDAN013922 [Ephemera danica]